MTEFETHGPAHRRFAPEIPHDTRNLQAMFNDAIIRSVTGEPVFTLYEQERADNLMASEAIEEAERYTRLGASSVANQAALAT